MSVAKAYAKALFETSQAMGASNEALIKVEQELELLEQAMTSSRELQIALESPLTTAKEKIALATEFARAKAFQPLTIEFLALLARKGRLRILAEVRKTLKRVRLESQGGTLGDLVSADQLSSDDIQELSKVFSQRLGKNVTFNVSTDPSLLAGLKVTVNGVTYDGTLRSQLQRLRDQFVHGTATAH